MGVHNQIIYAIIRRIDTNADDAIAIKEWTDFFTKSKVHYSEEVQVRRGKNKPHLFNDHCFKCHGGRPKKNSGAGGADGGDGGDGKVQNDVLFGLGILGSLAVATVNPLAGVACLVGAVATNEGAKAIDNHNAKERVKKPKNKDEDGNDLDEETEYEDDDDAPEELLAEESEEEEEEVCTCKILEEVPTVTCIPV